MTSLIDVIFLLLLFFMLSSTFTRFAELEIASATGGVSASDSPPLFVRLTPETLTLNGTELAFDTVAEAIDPGEEGQALLISLSGDVTSQRLTDLLVVLRPITGLAVTVLE